MGRPITEQKEISVKIEGSGNTKEQALDAAFASLKKQIGGTLLRIQPLEVEVLKAVEKQFTERFLMLFFPRVRKTYYLQLLVRVQIVSFCMDNLEFQTVNAKSELMDEGGNHYADYFV